MPVRGLYAIVDTRTLRARKVDVVAFSRAVLSARPAALQLRAKTESPREFLALLRTLSALCREAGVPFIANDRADLAPLAGCGCVHIGQDDLPIERVRKIAPGLRVGLSTHTPEQLARALDTRPEYVAYGPVFPTTSKEAPDPVVGLDGLRDAAISARRARVPLVAIGGITLARALDIATLADAGAVISALLPEGPGDPAARLSPEDLLQGVTARAKELHAVLSSPRTDSSDRVPRPTA
jgi:thiamine-phosphate pyrophosphorylase